MYDSNLGVVTNNTNIKFTICKLVDNDNDAIIKAIPRSIDVTFIRFNR